MSKRDSELDFERRSKALFDGSVAALDGATRSRLTQARYRALAQRAARTRGFRWALLPAGAVAAALMAWWLVPVVQPPSAGGGAQQVATASLGDLEILLAEEDLEMLDEDLDFYGWLEEQPEFVDASDNVG
jgi:hypothetical protein